MQPTESGRHVLVVEDDAITRRAVGDYLSEHGYHVHLAENGEAMNAILAKQPADMVILDVVLPGESGLDLARRIRKQGNVPIIMLTGRSDEIDRIIGLEIGADDYVVKPFSPRELVARISAVLRRRQKDSAPPPEGAGRIARFAGWMFDLDDRRLSTAAGEPVDLTSREADLLALFISRQNQVISRQEVTAGVGGSGPMTGKRSVDVTILRLRRKIEPNPKKPVLIKTLRKAGYIFAGPVTWGDGKSKPAAAS